MSRNIAALESVSDGLDTAAKWFRLMERHGVTLRQLLKPVNDVTARANLAVFLAAGCPEVKGAVKLRKRHSERCQTLEIGMSRERETADHWPQLVPGYHLARTILEDDFIPEYEIVPSLWPRMRYGAKSDRELEASIPCRETLEWLRDNNFLLVAGPSEPLSLLGIRAMAPEYFNTKDGLAKSKIAVCVRGASVYPPIGDWSSSEHSTANKSLGRDKVCPGWLMVRKEPFPGSVGDRVVDRSVTIPDTEYRPNIAEVAWVATVYKDVRDKYLFADVLVETSSKAFNGWPLEIGHFNRRGLQIWMSGKPVGLASGLKPKK